MNKRDIVSSRTPEDTERKYVKRIIDSEKKAKSQEADLAFLHIKINELNASLKTVNFQIEEINEICEGLNTSIGRIDTRLEAVEELGHSHSNKTILDSLSQIDIDKWNNQFTGDYNVLAENITINQQIQDIDDYNLILLQILNLNRYIPCFKYGDTYKGINITKDTVIDMEEISIQVRNETVINIICTNNILKVIGIF